jgi:hypothetical protein
MRNARAFSSPIRHLLPDGTMTTLCGLDARLMFRWADGEAGVDARIWKSCRNCDAAQKH